MSIDILRSCNAGNAVNLSPRRRRWRCDEPGNINNKTRIRLLYGIGNTGFQRTVMQNASPIAANIGKPKREDASSKEGNFLKEILMQVKSILRRGIKSCLSWAASVRCVSRPKILRLIIWCHSHEEALTTSIICNRYVGAVTVQRVIRHG